MTDAPVLAATPWPTNAHLVADVARLGYLRPEWHTLDPTYGRGVWWQLWRPDRLTAHDLDPDKAPDGPADFTALPYPDGTFDTAVFDPPYVSVGGRATSTLQATATGSDYHNRYGIDTAPTSPAGVQATIDDGLAEVARVVRPAGYVLVKCQDYVSSGRLWPGTHLTLTAALELGLEYVDRLEHVATTSRPQPGGRTRRCSSCAGDGCSSCSGTGREPTRQQHARRNLSNLLVFRTPRRPHAPEARP